MEKKIRYDNLDLLKAIAIVMVVSLHIPMWNTDFIADNNLSQYVQYFIRIICEGVPIFMTINGFLKLRNKESDLTEHLKKTLKLFVLFFVWAVILIIPSILVGGPFHSISDIIHCVLKTDIGSEYTGVLWFLIGIIATYLLFPVIHRIYNSDFRLYLYFFFLVGFFTVGLGIIYLIRDFILVSCGGGAIILEALEFLERFRFSSSSAYLLYVFYFMLGGVILHYYDFIVKNKKIFATVGLCSWILSYTYAVTISNVCNNLCDPSINYGNIFMTFIIIGMIAVSSDFKAGNNPIYRLIVSVGKCTLGMYLTHTIFIRVFQKFVPTDSFTKRVICFAAVIVCSYVATAVMKKIPLIKKLVEI
ncbi:MAG: acyltransferase [Clostridia bacterium]|nr:acyltransferase [Clostridia bacterium]